MPVTNKLALIIGIDKYASEDLKPLPSCKKDALDLSALLSKLGYTIFGGSPIIGSEISAEENGWTIMRKSIFSFFRQATPSQTLLFYFSGHGVHGGDEVYMASPEVDPKAPGCEGFSFSRLTRCMGKSKSKRIVGILDTCYSGATDLPSSSLKKKKSAESAAKEAAKNALRKYDRLYEDTPKSRGISLLLSSQSYEPSNAVEGRNSLYTEYLLKGLRGVKNQKEEDGTPIPNSVNRSGRVTPETLHEYVYYMVASKIDQVPEIKTDKSSEITLAHYPEMKEAAEVVTRPRTLATLDKEIGRKIEKRRLKIKRVCKRFLKLRREYSKKRKKMDNEYADEIENQAKVLGELYAESEGVKDDFDSLTNQQNEIEPSEYREKLIGLGKKMAHIEFKVDDSWNAHIKNLEEKVKTARTVEDEKKKERLSKETKDKKKVKATQTTQRVGFPPSVHDYLERFKRIQGAPPFAKESGLKYEVPSTKPALGLKLKPKITLDEKDKTLTQQDRDILQTLVKTGNAMTSKEIAKNLGLPDFIVVDKLRRLRRLDYISLCKNQKGPYWQYVITKQGRRALRDQPTLPFSYDRYKFQSQANAPNLFRFRKDWTRDTKFPDGKIKLGILREYVEDPKFAKKYWETAKAKSQHIDHVPNSIFELPKGTSQDDYDKISNYQIALIVLKALADAGRWMTSPEIEKKIGYEGYIVPVVTMLNSLGYVSRRSPPNPEITYYQFIITSKGRKALKRLRS